MPRVIKMVVGILGSLILIIIIAIILGKKLVRRTLPVKDGSTYVQGLNESVRIYRDDFGVPHIFARNIDDMFFAMGYVVAQDRLWQMDIHRRKANGSLAEIFGEEKLPIDQISRTIGFSRLANLLKDNISKESQSILLNYSAGINAFLTETKARLPVEYTIHNYPIPYWEIDHTLALHLLFAWECEYAWRFEPFLWQAFNDVDPLRYKDLFPVFNVELSEELRNNASSINDLFNLLQQFKNSPYKRFSVLTPDFNSNGYVIAGDWNATGKPIVINSFGSLLQNPSAWYEIHLTAPGINCCGITIPGIPAIFMGNNESISWSIQNVISDGIDFFVEKINPQNRNQYFYRGKWKDMADKNENIDVKDQQLAELKVRFTNHGPLISDLFHHDDSETALSMKWSGSKIADDFLCYWKIMAAKNLDQFKDGLKDRCIPVFNYIYADTQGTIGSFFSGNIFQHSQQENFSLLPGWTHKYETDVSTHFNQLPSVVNPDDGIILTKNTFLSNGQYDLWRNSDKFLIFQKVNIHHKIDANKFSELIDNQADKTKQMILHDLLLVMNSSQIQGDLGMFILKTLKTWDMKYENQSAAPTIFEIFMTYFYRNIFHDEFGDTLFQTFVNLQGLPESLMEKIVKDKKSIWFDNIKTHDVKEKYEDLLLLTLDDTYKFIQNNPGEQIYDWRWGNQHLTSLKHPISSNPHLNKFFNINNIPRTNIACTTYDSDYLNKNRQLKTIYGTTAEQVVDLGNLTSSSWVINTGQSSNPLSHNYQDQIELMAKGQFHEIIIDSLILKNKKYDLLRLQSKP